MSLHMVVPPPNLDFIIAKAEESNDSNPAVTTGRQIDFVALPSDPADLTTEHAHMLFSSAGVATVLRQLAALARTGDGGGGDA